ncbi:hypothetical protein MBLNU459_g5728t1 [Dothideomycetes sp. NU459]
MGAPTNPYQPYASVHENPAGPGDARPSALQIIEDEKLKGKWSDKVILITGSSAGIGVETAKALHATGAKLFLAVRDIKKGEKVLKDILGNGTVELLELDLASLDSVRAAAKDFLSRSKQLNVLINNAGIMACPEGRTVDGFETQIGTNHFGHFLLFQLLKPTLLASSSAGFNSRVVNVSSAGHQISDIRFHDINFEDGDYNNWAAYGQSKTANVWMANAIDRHYGSRGLHAVSLHPGVIFDTELTRHLQPSDFDRLGGLDAYDKVKKTTPQGAATTVWAATTPYLEGKGGVYLADVGEAPPKGSHDGPGGPGYAPHAYNEEGEEKLWKLSYEKLGLKED